jgi:hypothetical protein
MRHPQAAIPSVTSRRCFLRSVSIAATTSMFSVAQLALAAPHATANTPSQKGSALDEKRMRALAAWTALTFQTPNPVPYGAEIVHSESGESLIRATNAVRDEHDPSAHAELRSIRLACKKLNAYSLSR